LVIGGRCEPPPDLDPARRSASLDPSSGPIGALVESARRGLALGADPALIRSALLALQPSGGVADRFAPDPERIAPYQRSRQAARLRDLAISLLA
jgi:hypothetical protein